MRLPKTIVFILLFFTLFEYAVLSQAFISKETPEEKPREIPEYASEWSGINPKQPISIDEKIYTMTKMQQEVTELSGAQYRKERLWDIQKYVYRGFENGSVKVLYVRTNEKNVEDTTSRYGASLQPQGKIETEEISLPANLRKRALLETADGKKLVITVADEDNRITVEEFR